MPSTDLEVEAGSGCTCPCSAGRMVACHMGGSASAQVAY